MAWPEASGLAPRGAFGHLAATPRSHDLGFDDRGDETCRHTLVGVYEDPPISGLPADPGEPAVGATPPTTVSWPPVAAPAVEPPVAQASTPPPAPSYAAPPPDTNPPLAPPPFESVPSGTPPPRFRTPARLTLVFVVVALIAGFGVTTLILNATDSTKKNAASTTPSTAAPAPTAPPTTVPADPHAGALSALIVNQTDVPLGYRVQLQAGGSDFVRGTTLDLCNGTYKSESLRTARRQVVVLDAQDTQVFSTEAVLYKTPDAAAQALKELRTVAAKCPNRPVTSPVGEPTAVTRFLAAPDAAWPHAAGVTRVAFDFTVASQGQTIRSTAVYLWRGRALLALYFPSSQGDQVAIQDKTTIPKIDAIFEARLSALPVADVK